MVGGSNPPKGSLEIYREGYIEVKHSDQKAHHSVDQSVSRYQT